MRFEPDARARIAAQSEDELLVRGDAALLASMLENALGNALKFTDDTIDLRITSHGAQAWIEVIDRGPGVPSDERRLVFALFYRTVSARAQGAVGHGLGLALIARVAQAHGGQAEFIEAPRGAHLRVQIPRWGAPAPCLGDPPV
jgi:signal transduction histidine kinase